MRIVITKNGKKFIRELDDEELMNIRQKMNKNNLLSSTSKLPVIQTSNEKLIKKFNRNNNEFFKGITKYKETIGRTNSLIDKNLLENFYHRDDVKIDEKELSKAKIIKLSHPKINMSQAFYEKYDDYGSGLKKRLENLTNNLSIKNENTKIENSNNQNLDVNLEEDKTIFTPKERTIKLGNILSKNNIEILKEHFSKINKGLNDVRLPLDENNLMCYNFRTKFENKKTTQDEISYIKNYTINQDKINIIKYYQKDTPIYPQYVENLLKYNEQQMFKLNKICKKICDRDEKEKSILDLNKKKLLSNNKTNKNKEVQNINILKDIMKRSNSIIDTHTNKQKKFNFWKKNGYKESINKIKEKYWDRYNINRFMTIRQREEMKKMTEAKNMKDSELKAKLKGSQSTPDIFAN